MKPSESYHRSRGERLFPVARFAPFAVALVMAIWSSGKVQGSDVFGQLTAADSPLSQPGRPNQLRLVEPAPLPSALRVHPAAQPEPMLPGPAIPGGNSAQPGGPAPQPLPESVPSVDDVSVGIKPIGEVNVNITIPGAQNASEQTPADLAAPRFAKAGVIYPPASEYRPWMASSFYWEAPGSSHNPLYFEEINLERYGYTYGCLQPAVSAAHFFATIPLLPYEMVVHPPGEVVYSLGYYRPGDPAERQRRRISLRPGAGAIETGFVIGTILLLH